MAKNKVEDLQSKKVCADSRTLFAGAGVLLSHLRNVVRFWRERKLIAVTRRAVRNREVRSDREIIRIAVRRQPWTYYKELMTR